MNTIKLFRISFLLFCINFSYVWGQEGIGTNAPHPSAALEIESPDKGLLIPRLSLTSSSSLAPVTGTASSSHNGLLVYNTTTTETNGLTGEGFYVWQGGATGHWRQLQLRADDLGQQTLVFGSSATATQTTLAISDGNALTLQASGSLSFSQTGTDTLELAVAQSDPTTLVDADGDTKVQVEEGTDDDTIRFDTRGTERMVITDDGRVGIGTSSILNSKLTVSNSGNDGITLRQNTNADRFKLFVGDGTNGYTADDNYIASENTDLIFINSNPISAAGERMRIDVNGNVGIGTATPAAKLQVNDSSLNGNAAVFIQENTTQSNGVIIRTGTASATDSAFFVESDGGANDIFMIRNNGKVGIGTTAPQGVLDVKTTVAGETALRLQKISSSAFDFQTGITGVTGDALLIRDITLSHDYLTLRSGNVGIGTTNPGFAKLVVESSGTEQAMLLENLVTGGPTNNNLVYKNAIGTTGSYVLLYKNGGSRDNSQQDMQGWALNTAIEYSDQFTTIIEPANFKGWAWTAFNPNESEYINYMNIGSNGKVGIGTETPDHTLTVGDVNASEGGTVRINNVSLSSSPTIPSLFISADLDSSLSGNPSGSAAIGVARSNQGIYSGQLRFLPQYFNGTSYTYAEIGLVVDPTGNSGDVNVGIGTAAPTVALDVVGDIKATGTVMSSSDRRFKRNIATIDQAVTLLMEMRGVRYEWNTEAFPERNFPEEDAIGVIAQEVEKVLPEVVHTDSEGFKSVDYSKLSALLIEAIKEQQQQIDAQETRLKRIENELGIN